MINKMESVFGVVGTALLLICITGLILSIAHSAQRSDPYNMTLLCSDELKQSIIAEHVRVTMKGSIYLLERNDGHYITYEKSSFAYCVSLLDADVVRGTPP